MIFANSRHFSELKLYAKTSKLCATGCMNDDCILMLSCCRGGLMQVAYTLFYYCSHISYVLGPRQSLTSADMHICFGFFL